MVTRELSPPDEPPYEKKRRPPPSGVANAEGEVPVLVRSLFDRDRFPAVPADPRK